MGAVGGYFVGVYLPYNTSQAAKPYVLHIGGSSTCFPLINASLAEFSLLYPNISVTLDLTDSGTGIKDVNNGTYEIGESSKGNGATAITDNCTTWNFARDAVCVITNKDIPSLNLTQADLNAIFNGTFTTWDQLNGYNGISGLPTGQKITVISREPTSGTYQYFLPWINASSLTTYTLASGYVQQGESALVQSAVVNTPYSIGYVGLAFTSGASVDWISNVTTKANANGNPAGYSDSNLADFIQPTVANAQIQAGQSAAAYPISRNLWLLTNGLTEGTYGVPAVNSPAWDFINFMFSSYGQACVFAAGGVPLTSIPIAPSTATSSGPYNYAVYHP